MKDDTVTDVDSRAFDPPMRAVLDWLARHEPRCYDFSEVAQHCGMKRGEVEAAIVRLRHERAGRALSSVGPDGKPLFSRTAYLPPDSPHRAGQPPPVEVAPSGNPLEQFAARRRAKKEAKAVRRASEAEQLAAAKVERARSEKDARKAAQELIRQRLVTAREESPAPAKPPEAAPTPKRRPAVTPKADPVPAAPTLGDLTRG